jgi:hypothetical protein
MIKRADSLRGQGFTTLATDKPTKAKLQAAAAAAGLTLSEYIRVLADTSASGPGHLIPAVKSEDLSRQVESLSSRAIEMSRYIPMSDYRRMMVISLANKNTKFSDLQHAQLLFDKMESEFEAVKDKAEAKQKVKVELNLESA